VKATKLDEQRIRANTEAGHWAGNLVDGYLTRSAIETPGKVAVVDRGRAWTYGDLDQSVNRFAAALSSRGIANGDVVSWMLPNWAEAIVVHLAAIRLGAVSNPIIPIYRHRETAFILRQAATKAIVVPKEFRGFDYLAMIDAIRPEVPDLQTIVVVGGTSEDAGIVRFEDLLEESNPNPADHRPRDANDIALLLYTSGTTSDAKGALHSHNTLDYENRSIIDFFGLTESDVVFMPSPVGHIIGVLYGLQLPFMLGSTVVLLDIWKPQQALELIAEHACSFVVAATPFLHPLVHFPTLADYDMSSLRVFACGGADVPPELIRNATTALGCMVSRGYGSTEYPTASASNSSDDVAQRAQTDGRAIGAAQVRLAPDGELQVLGPELFLGYLDSSLNEAAYTDDGWFQTGDLANIDDAGYVEIIGRKKDILLRNGENLSAKEIEDQLFEHPKVADVAVVGSPDPIVGERVCAVIVSEPDQSVTLPELVEWLEARQMARQKLPERLLLVEDLPRNASGKIQKFKLRDLARQTTAPDQSPHIVSQPVHNHDGVTP
jgi:cyclohexanecarboxylate-CoA ligase